VFSTKCTFLAILFGKYVIHNIIQHNFEEKKNYLPLGSEEKCDFKVEVLKKTDLLEMLCNDGSWLKAVLKKRKASRFVLLC